jgi:ribosomal protein S18 acetylase RimI-like enzyme
MRVRVHGIADDLLALAHHNLHEFVRETGRLGGGSVVEQQGMLFAAGSSDFPVGYSNSAIRIDRALSASDAVEAADAFFGRRGRGYTLVVRAESETDLVEQASARGQKPLSDSPFMTIEQAPTEPPGEEIDLRVVKDAATARDLIRVNREAYADLGMPTAQTDALFGIPARLLEPHIHAAVAYLEGRPVSTALSLSTDRAAGIYWVGTVPEARQRGLGERCTRAVTRVAFERGAHVVALEASRMGFPIYERMGFRTVGNVQWYVTPPPQS